MTTTQKLVGWIVLVVFLTACMALVASSAHATECPPGMPKCKVLVLTPDMEQILIGPNMIFDTAEWGNRVGLAPAISYLRKAIQEAPSGEPGKPAPDGKPEPKK